MREIKFRAYSKKELRMINGYPVIKKGIFDSFVEDITGCIYGTESWDMQLMQFTGKTDISGTDIYQGDIVKQKFVKEIFEDSFITVISEVYWAEGHGGFALRDIATNQSHFTLDSLHCEIIGNIHQHPELLGK